MNRAASIGSVLAPWPMALAKARICPGLAIARQAGPREGRSYNGLQAAGGLEHDEVGLQNLETRNEVVEPGTSARGGKIFTTWTHGNIEAVLGYVDTNGDLLHGDPSLSKRARGAAPTTVRVRWNGGRGAMLSNGLRGPKVRRTPARHRARFLGGEAGKQKLQG